MRVMQVTSCQFPRGVKDRAQWERPFRIGWWNGYSSVPYLRDGTTREAPLPLDGSVTVPDGSFMEPRKLMLSPPWLIIVVQASMGKRILVLGAR